MPPDDFYTTINKTVAELRSKKNNSSSFMSDIDLGEYANKLMKLPFDKRWNRSWTPT